MNAARHAALTASASPASSPVKPPVCASCASIPDHERGYVTTEYETHTSYLSTRSPVNTKLYPIVRQACVQRYESTTTT